MKVNGINKKAAEKYLDECFETWRERSTHEWKLDITFLDEYLK